MQRFNKQTLLKLEKSGWKPNRKEDIQHILIKASKEEIDISSNIQSFLMEFTGLCLEYPNGQEPFDFAFYDFCFLSENINRLRAETEPSVIPFGVMYDGNYELSISDTGKIFALTSGYNDVFLLANNYDAGIAFICKYGASGNRDVFDSIRLK